MNVKKIFNKENLKPVIVLSVICIVIAATLAVVNMISAPVIEAEAQRKINESLSSVMPGGDFEQLDISIMDGVPETVTAIYKDRISGGHVVTLEKQGYADKIYITAGIDDDGKVTSAVITGENESHGKGQLVNDYVAGFSGKSGSEILGLDTVSGATKTSGYIASAVYDAFVALGYETPLDTEDNTEIPGGVTTTTDEKIIQIANSLMPGKYTKGEISGAPATVKAVFERAEGGCAIHIATRTEWRPLETEGVVTVDARGSITGVKMLYWNVGYDGTTQPKPPLSTEEFLNSEAAERYVASFVGKNASSLNRVELITTATNTSNNFENALRAALEVLYPTPVYSVIAIIAVCVLAIAALGAVVYFKIKRKGNRENLADTGAEKR